MSKNLSSSVARELLRYEPDTGRLFWRARSREWFSTSRAFATWNSRFSGKEAFTSEVQGYRQGRIFDRPYFAHRVIWLLQTGEWPAHQVDHINHVRTDNRWSNLREVTHAENLRNQSLRNRNTSGVVGVALHPQSGMWRARICVDGIQKHIGLFNSMKEAVAARKDAEAEFGYHQNHGRKLA